ncbi:YesL family protein [Halobacillus seohaensis]|uniref:YesL family protein n=1 Tax=Halobacillus seohaensis TaxID=447421 RepID=A0ABW2EPW8_9BACI
MGLYGLTTFVYQITLWIARLAYLNVLWFVFTLMGLGLLGIFPATAATFALVRLWIQDRSTPVLRKFWSEYKQNFIKSNKLGWSVVPFFATGIIVLNWSLGSTSSISLVVTVLAVIGLIVVSFYSLYLFPVLSHYNVDINEVYKYAFYIAASYPHYACGIIILWIIMVTGFFYTGFLIFFFASITALIFMYGSEVVFNKIQIKQTRAETV